MGATAWSMREVLGGDGQFIVLTVVMVSQLHTYDKTYQTAHFKRVHFIVCQLYLNKAIKRKNPKKIK